MAMLVITSGAHVGLSATALMPTLPRRRFCWQNLRRKVILHCIKTLENFEPHQPHVENWGVLKSLLCRSGATPRAGVLPESAILHWDDTARDIQRGAPHAEKHETRCFDSHLCHLNYTCYTNLSPIVYRVWVYCVAMDHVELSMITTKNNKQQKQFSMARVLIHSLPS